MKIRSIFVQLAAASQLALCMAAVGIASMGGQAAAASIPVNNFSFEDDPPGYAVSPTITGWVFSDPQGDVGGTQDQGTFNPGPPESGNPPGTLGNQWAFLNLHNTGNPSSPATGSITSSATVTTFAPDTRYQLTVAVGSNTQLNYGYYAPGDFTISILANGTPVATGSVSGTSLTLGTLTDLSTNVFTTGASGGVVGDALTIELYSVSNNVFQAGGGEQSLFDNVRLDATELPEPSSVVALIGLGATGLFLFARRHRKS